MICNKCNSQNKENANFCEECGSPLTIQASSRRVKRNPLRPHKTTKIKNTKPNLTILNYLMSHKQIWVFVSIFLTIFIVLVAINFNNSNNSNNNRGRFLDIASKNPIIEAKVFEIAANFVCGCGSCNEESLEICKCSYAVEERQFIRDYLEQNRNSTEIITAMTSKYGGLKPDVSTANDNKQSFKIPTNSSTNKLGIATFADRENIYSAFNCPCGQCSVDELKDCTC
ncbi:MAG: zinc-ribbon domain-containing protein, partial [Ignavibacteriae bacterium]|nr:zinc-ribbon domain-containing protein [Ignavibacteriota bacterium]